MSYPKTSLEKRKTINQVRTVFHRLSAVTSFKVILHAQLARSFCHCLSREHFRMFIQYNSSSCVTAGQLASQLPLTMTRTPPNTAKCPPQGSAWLRTSRVKDRNKQLCVIKIRRFTPSHQHRPERAGNKP